jgi:hypothetical protein
MSFGAELVARVLGLPEVPVRAVQRGIWLFLIVMIVAMPITFRHGLTLFAQQRAEQIEHQILDPLLAQLQRMPTTPPPSPAPTSAPDAPQGGPR